MRRLMMLSLLTLAIALPLHAQQRGQSYFTYDDGGTIVRAAAEDGRDIDVRINMPVYPGDEVITNRRGRTEIRLSDGNVLALDRSTDLRFRSILDSYDGNASQTVAELRYGHIVVQRTQYGRETVRVDTDNASYLASDAAIYAVESDRGRDHITVFSGDVEVRTPERTARVSEGDDANVDDTGMYRLTRDYGSADDFEQWFLRRADRYGRGSSRYLDSSLAYADPELAENGSWVYVSSFNTWCWRPRVATGWRPFFYGEWMYGLGGSLVWVSYEPWGWVPYHYGRWAWDTIYGWVWLPGTGYSPAWVYWMYGPGYIGWAPAGWWDCFGAYYSWAYRPYWNSPWNNYGGWYGHVPGRDIDFRPWTFVNPNHIVGQRVDRGSLPIETVRERLRRDPGGNVTITPNPARFSRNELRDPADAINNIVRRGSGGGGATQVGDMAPFIRRDANISPTLRERLVRTQPVQQPSGGLSPTRSGGLAPIGGGGLSPIGGGPLAPIGGNDGRVSRGDAGQNRGTFDRNAGNGNVDRGGSVDRGGAVRRGGESPSGGAVDRGGNVNRGGNMDRGGSSDRGTIDRGSSAPAPSTSAPPPAPPPSTPPPAANPPTWRERVERPSTGAQQRQDVIEPRNDWRGRSVSGGDSRSGASDVPRRVIDRIGGARVYPNDGGSRDSGSHYSPPPRDSTPRYSPPPSSSGGSRGNSGGGSVNRGGGSGGGGSRSSGGGGGGGGGGHSSGGSSSGGSHSSSGSSGGGGHVHRN